MHLPGYMHTHTGKQAKCVKTSRAKTKNTLIAQSALFDNDGAIIRSTDKCIYKAVMFPLCLNTKFSLVTSEIQGCQLECLFLFHGGNLVNFEFDSCHLSW